MSEENPCQKKIRVLSLGAGVNSTALLVLCSQGKVDFDFAIFAETGNEHPETYDYLENVIIPFCIRHKITIIRLPRGGVSKTLYQEYFDKHIIPTRKNRSCTDHFKIRPIKQYLWDLEEKTSSEVVCLIGFCKGEERRRNSRRYALPYELEYPLIDLGIDREGCKQIIRSAGLPIPIKSGCFFCPFTKVRNWKWLHRTHPDLFEKAKELEQNGRRYPELTLYGKLPLAKVIVKRELCDWQTKPCSLCEVE